MLWMGRGTWKARFFLQIFVAEVGVSYLLMIHYYRQKGDSLFSVDSELNNTPSLLYFYFFLILRQVPLWPFDTFSRRTYRLDPH